MDVIAICCDFTEYIDFEALQRDYGYLVEFNFDPEDAEIEGYDYDDYVDNYKDELIAEISNRTIIQKLPPDGYILQVF